MVTQIEITLRARSKGFHLITDDVLDKLRELPEKGLLNLFILHTSAALSVNENADATVREDLDLAFDHIAPASRPFYKHTVEGPDDMPAHIKSVLVGSSISVPIQNHRLRLGTWQGIYLCEFRENAPRRKLVMTVLS